MSTTTSFQPSTETDLHAFLAEVARAPVQEALSRSSGMQRLRLTSLPNPVMERLCESLQGDPRWAARMLSDGSQAAPWKASATKIIELRNTLESPLLVFIPSGLRTAAEDSLDIATFSELALPDLTRHLVEKLLGQFPDGVRAGVKQAVEYLRLEKVIRNADEEVEYLLTVWKNGADAAAAGRALYVFRLIPDDLLLTHPNLVRRLSLNLRASEELANIQRPLRERIGRLPVRPGTVQKDLFAYLRLRHTDAPRSWAAEIACVPSHAHLNLAKWDFDDGGEQKLRLALEPLDLPLQTPDAVSGAAQMAVLDLSGKQGLKVSARSFPKPAEMTAWKNFRVQLLSVGEEGPAVAWESNSFPKPGGRNQKFSRTIKTSELAGLDEGTYFLKIDAYDQNGALLTERRPVDPDKPEGRAENESDFFLVTAGVEPDEVEAPSPRLTRVPSLLDAYFMVAGRAASAKPTEEAPPHEQMTGAWSQPVAASLRGDVYFELEGPAWQGFAVAVPGVFRRLELAILTNPAQLGPLRLDCVEARDAADLQVERRDAASFPDWPEAEEFLAARKEAFAALHGQHIVRAGKPDEQSVRAGIVETGDLLALGEQILRYAKAYRGLAERLLDSESVHQTFPGALKLLALTDVVEVSWRRTTGDPGRALLLSPTHPLRLLWHLQHAVVCANALDAVREGQKAPSPTEFLRQMRVDLTPSNLPLVLFDTRGRGYIDHGGLTPYWSFYLPEGENGDRAIDVSGCRDHLRRLLGIRPNRTASPMLSDRQIAFRAGDYLEQHPYVEQLRINVFNPGDGELLAEALRAIEREQLSRRLSESTGLLRYSVQMFGEGEGQLETMGEALESLLDPERQSAEGDEFTLVTTNHLLPKLVFARNTVEDFLRSPASYPAHITIFLEHFNARSKLSHTNGLRRGSFVSGLIQEPEIALEPGEQCCHWSKGVRPAAGTKPDRWEAELCAAHDSMQRLQAAAAAGQPQAKPVSPVVSLHLDPPSLSLLKHSHEVSDWVVTIDRHLGVEYFDSGRTSEEFGYLLDFSPATLQADRPRVMLSTRCSWELAGLLRPIFERLGWPVSDCHTEVVLESLRSLSGRLAFRLLGSPHHVDETAGLLLARWLLDRAGLLSDRVIIPLDAHLSWFRRRSEDEGDGPSSRQRADLLLVGFEPKTAALRMTVVEVKFRDSLSPSERSYLYRSMKEQADNTVRWLRERFDPDAYPEARADAALCAKELATTLAF